MCPVIRDPSCFKSKYVRRTVPSGKGSRATQLPVRPAARQHTWAAARNRIGLIMCESAQSCHLSLKEASGVRCQQFRLRCVRTRMHVACLFNIEGVHASSCTPLERVYINFSGAKMPRVDSYAKYNSA